MADEVYIEPAGDDYEDEDYLSSSAPPDHPRQTLPPDTSQATQATVSTTSDSFDLDSMNQPYIHLNGLLPNLTKNEGEVLRLKCNVAGTLPIDFRWYKNDAPLLKEKNRIVVKNRDYWSRLIIRILEPLDQAFYRCEGINKAGSVNSTALIQVIPNKVRGSYHNPTMGSKRPNDHPSLDYSDPDDDTLILKPHTCQEYPFEACRKYLAGQKIYIHSRNIEDMRDIDRRLRAAFIVISNSSQVSDECKVYAARAACFHSYSICDSSSGIGGRNSAGSSKGSPVIRRICKQDCDKLEKDICQAEYEAARSQNLIGKEKDQILPNCRDLDDDVDKCLRVVTDDETETSGIFCYSGNGESYRGQISSTKSGLNCQKWSDAAKKNPAFSPSKHQELKFHNFCRNPGAKDTQPWCFNSKGAKEHCDIPRCPPGSIRHSDQGNSDTGSGVDNGIMGIPAEYAQYVLLAAGIFGVLLIVALVLMACYCVRKSRRNRNGKMKKTNGVVGGQSGANGASASLLPQTAMNGHAHHPHQRDYYNGGGAIANGIRKPVVNGQQIEMSSLLPQQIPSIPPPPPSSSLLDTLPEIPCSNIEYIEELGQGQFGKVWRAKLIGYSTGLSIGDSEDGHGGEDQAIQVAVKTLKDDASPRMRQDFEHEVSLMARLKHPNIVELIGVSCMRTGSSASSSLPNSTPASHPSRPCMVFEYMMHGNLNEFLLLRSPYSQPETVDNERILLDHSDFLHIATQIASGMEYLASQHYVHRDLATRNCLVADRLTIKISDFGLMRDVYASDYYRQQSNTFLPIRWMPPEAIMYGRYSEASDVWAYGVTLWEIYSYGTQPYYGYNNPDVAEMVRQRCLLACPDNCPPRMYSLMVECWHETPSRRPRFAEIHARLQTWSVVSSPAHSSTAHGIGCASNNRIGQVNGRVTSSSAHSDRSAGNSSGTSSCRTRSNGGPIGSAGQIMSTNSIIALGSIPPAGTPSSRNSPYPSGNGLPSKNVSSSPQLPRTPLSVNGYALRASSSKPYSGLAANDMEP